MRDADWIIEEWNKRNRPQVNQPCLELELPVYEEEKS